MGTSGSYGGPGPGGSLLPPGAPAPPLEPSAIPDSAPNEPGEDGDSIDDGGEQGDGQPKVHPWARTKTDLSLYSRYSSEGSTAAARKALGRAARGFVRSQQGARMAAASSPAGRMAGRSLGQFISAAARDGVEGAIRGLGLGDFVGAEAPVLVAALTQALSPGAGQDEEDVARRAMASTLAKVLESEGDEGSPFSSLDVIDADGARGVLNIYVVEYIDGRLMHVLGSRPETKAKDEREVIRQEREIKDFVSRRVGLLMKDEDVLAVDWNGREGFELVESVFEEAYELLEAEE
jgi:hypothetical protein